MKIFVKILLVVASLNLFNSQVVYADIKLPPVISSNMVLQRNTSVVLWGWADAKESITFKFPWLNDEIKTKTNKDGHWRIAIKTTNDKSPQTIKISGKTSNILLENILFGEVWLCSGQSNMEQTLKGYSGQPTFHNLETLARANNPNLRLFTVEHWTSKTPLNHVGKYKEWQHASPDNVKDFSAIAYFFAEQSSYRYPFRTDNWSNSTKAEE